MSALALSKALAVALACIPQAAPGRLAVSPDVILSVARTESGFDPLAIHDNATGAALHPAMLDEAVAVARRLIADGHRPDLGFAQINASNLGWTGLTVRTAFDPCASIQAEAKVLLAAYAGGTTDAARQAALLRALSAYNTGSPTAGAGYVQEVLASARKIIPALRLAGVGPYAPPAAVSVSPAPSVGPRDPNEPPAWDVWAHQAWEVRHAASAYPAGGHEAASVAALPASQGTN